MMFVQLKSTVRHRMLLLNIPTAGFSTEPDIHQLEGEQRINSILFA